ncbi:hypothetical protein NA57DRAFT_53527 [Rhizodiscina lignyota]|uniref:Pentatricopeptide repeat-containing protein n=1 Tax=Rhizodiscina lignyota TaxID=1504668 RepID=A0A9P4IKW5_9PEZI|nr:hypothetical protein NA57DRAFT_53527 [Rhizodiscina lignyota]
MTPLRILLCPSAPFLLPPRALFAFRRAVAATVVPKKANYTTFRQKQAKEIPKRGGPPRKRAHKSLQHELTVSKIADQKAQNGIVYFRDLLSTEDVSRVIEAYPEIIRNPFLARSDTRKLCQLLHEAYRQKSNVPTVVETLKAFSESIIQDYQKGSLPPHPVASVHLLSFLRESKQYDRASELWSWLAGQNQDYVSPHLYGVAIEIQTQQVVPLEKLEELYKDALRRFPGQFLGYHFSPTAIVQDRSQFTIIKGLSSTLLQGIFTARILSGDWINGYLAFDTALRLFPTQVQPRFFEVLLYERPMAEAYHAFMVACRAGIVLSPKATIHLLGKLLDGHLSAPNAAINVLNVMIAYAGTRKNAPLPFYFVGIFIKAMTQLAHSVKNEDAGFERATRQRLGQATCKIVLTLLRAGVEPNASIFNSLLKMAMLSGQPELHWEILGAMKVHEVKPNVLTYSALLNIMLATGDFDEFKSAWTAYVASVEGAGEQLPLKEWINLARAAADRFPGSGPSFVEEQLLALKHTLTEFKEELIRTKLHEDARTSEPQSQMNETESFQDSGSVETFMDRLLEKESRLKETMSSAEPHDFYNMPMPLDPFMDDDTGVGTAKDQTSLQLLAEHVENLRKLYDELTTDPYLPAPEREESAPVPQSRTGYPLEELRFQNWKSVTGLMLQAAQSEKAEEIIARAGSSSTETATITTNKTNEKHSGPLPWPRLRQRILELRGYSTAAASLDHEYS